MTTHALSERSILEVLTRDRLVAIGREFGVSVSPRAKKDEQVQSLVQSGELQVPALLRVLGRDELRAACKAHGLADSGRARTLLAERLLGAAGADPSAAPAPFFARTRAKEDVPKPGDIAHVRHRQYLVEEVVPPPEEARTRS